MNLPSLRHASVCAMLTAASLLTACSPDVLDFRNAEIVNGSIYRTGSDKPFSGRVTNAPERAVLDIRKEHWPFLQTLGNVFQLLKLSSPSAQAVCDIGAKDGVLDGRATCTVGPNRILKYEANFDEGMLDGHFKTYYQAKKDSVLAEATFAKGVLDGDMKIYGPATGSTVFQLRWKDGKPEGKEEMFDEATGKLVSRSFYQNGVLHGESVSFKLGTDLLLTKMNVVNGVKDGLEEVFDYETGYLKERRQWKAGKPDGDQFRAKLDDENRVTEKLVLSARYVNGVKVQLPTATSSLASPADVSGCIEARTTAFRIEHGEGEITVNQLGEWELACRNDKQPS